MGMNALDLKLVNDLREQGLVPDGARVLEIGAQQLSNDFLRAAGELARSASLFRTETPPRFPDPLPAHILEGGEEHLPAEAPLTRTFWEWVGFEQRSIDIDGSPGAKAIDLNSGRVPVGWRGRFDLVLNLGTTEHVADQENAFKIVHDATKPDGIMIHHLPSQGWFNHGLLNYPPTFFYALAEANRYRFHLMDLRVLPVTYAIPAELLAHISTFDPDAPSRLGSYSAVDCTIRVALQKGSRRAYVAPFQFRRAAFAQRLRSRLRYRLNIRTRARRLAARRARGSD